MCARALVCVRVQRRRRRRRRKPWCADVVLYRQGHLSSSSAPLPPSNYSCPTVILVFVPRQPRSSPSTFALRVYSSARTISSCVVFLVSRRASSLLVARRAEQATNDAQCFCRLVLGRGSPCEVFLPTHMLDDGGGARVLVYCCRTGRGWQSSICEPSVSSPRGWMIRAPPRPTLCLVVVVVARCAALNTRFLFPYLSRAVVDTTVVVAAES